ncbi:metallophosphoesterase [Alteriqipengyuania sp. 357]
MSDFAPHRPRRRTVLLTLLAVATVIGALVAWKTSRDTLSDPEVKRTAVSLPDWPAGSDPVTLALISDIHVAGPDMPPDRLERIVAQVNALHPDAIVIAGDLVSEKGLATRVYPPGEIIAPLGSLSAPLGVFLVPGNHDHWFGWPGLKAQLERIRITTLENEAAQAGPLVIGGLDDDHTDHDDIPKTLAAVAKLDGAPVFLSHSPDPLPDLPQGSVILAGHTHCGQVQLPLIGMVFTQSRYGKRFACGRTDDPHGTAIVGAGLGTSGLPLRFGTRPQVWLIEFRAADRRSARSE